ncbi:hypothetical protein DYH55_06500 [Methylovirgula sp. 4M-Z18]|nr:hypothetical protein DYH55_06500 [Methylovirgula sp. 4M-Z18]
MSAAAHGVANSPDFAALGGGDFLTSILRRRAPQLSAEATKAVDRIRLGKVGQDDVVAIGNALPSSAISELLALQLREFPFSQGEWRENA